MSTVKAIVGNFVPPKRRKSDKETMVAHVLLEEGDIRGFRKNMDGIKGHGAESLLAILDLDEATKTHLREVCNAAIAKANAFNGKTETIAPPPIPGTEPTDYAIVKGGAAEYITKTAAAEYAKSNPDGHMSRLTNNKWDAWTTASHYFPQVKQVKGEVVGPLSEKVNAARKQLASA